MLLRAPVSARAEPFSLRDTDKQAHVAVSYGLTLTGALALRKLELPRWQAAAVAGGATLALGALKELAIDKHASGADMLANGLGTGAAALVMFTFEL